MPSAKPFLTPTPLTDDEFTRLGDFLGSISNSGAMNLEKMDGFFTALVCGPEMVLPSEYMPYVWGDETPKHGVFQSLEEAQEILNLVNRHWNTIAGTLFNGRVYFPSLFEDEKGVAHGNDWAKGFLRGMSLRRDSWNELLDDEEHGGCLVPIFLLAHEHDLDPKLRPKPVSPKKRKDILIRIIAGIPVVYEYFRAHRRSNAKP